MSEISITKQALNLILHQINPNDSDGEEIALQPDTDISSDEETPWPSEKRRRLETDSRLTKNGTEWHEEQVGRPLPHSQIECHAAEGEPSDLVQRTVSTRLQSFLCFLTLDMLKTIQDCTVQHGCKTLGDSWFMSLPELKAFIAILLLHGLSKCPIEHAWSADMGNLIHKIMDRNRFFEILQYLHFDNKATRCVRVETDKFAAISNVWESFVSNCIASFNPGRNITIDEQLFPTKTRSCFLRYVPTKPDKFGIKFWVACDLKSKYVCNIIPDLGKHASTPEREKLSENVVIKLMEPFLDKGRTVSTNNCLTSVSLARHLLSRKTSLIGAVTCRELPESVKKTLNHNEFSTQVFSTSGVTLTVYKATQKKAVCILSTVHNMVETEDTRKRKPNTVTDYNCMKGGVEEMDHIVRQYSVRSATQRWPVAVFYNMIDIAALNAQVLYQACTGVKERRVDFLVNLGIELAESHVEAEKAKKGNCRQQQSSTPNQGKRALCQVNGRCKKNHATMHCVDCHRLACGKCRKETVWKCQLCAKNADG